MPATAVGSANGRSTRASTRRRPGKAVAHQHPGDDQAEDGVDQRAARAPRRRTGGRRRGRAARSTAAQNERPAEATPPCSASAASGSSTTSAEVEEREAERQPEAGQTLVALCRQPSSATGSLPRLVDLVEDAAVGEVRLLGLRPAAEDLVDREQLQPAGTRTGALASACWRARPVVVLRGDRLALGRVEELEVGLGDARACPCLSTTLSTTATGGSARMLSDGTTISTLSGPSSLTARNASFSQASSTSPMPALDEGVRRAAGAGVEHRDVLEQPR